MDKQARQAYCLNKMGITQFVRRSLVVVSKQQPFLVCLEAKEKQALNLPERKQLLDKMFAALRWPAANIAIEFIRVEDPHLEALLAQKIQESRPQKILLFGFEFGKKLQGTFQDNQLLLEVGHQKIKVSQVPALDTLLTDLSAKKAAWKSMQWLI
jgi:hypothetical protein